jgi:hypothetical protein
MGMEFQEYGYYPYDGYYDHDQLYSYQTWYYCSDPAGYYPYVTQWALVQIASTSRRSLPRRAEFSPEARRSRRQVQLDLERRDVAV